MAPPLTKAELKRVLAELARIRRELTAVRKAIDRNAKKLKVTV